MPPYLHSPRLPGQVYHDNKAHPLRSMFIDTQSPRGQSDRHADRGEGRLFMEGAGLSTRGTKRPHAIRPRYQHRPGTYHGSRPRRPSLPCGPIEITSSCSLQPRPPKTPSSRASMRQAGVTIAPGQPSGVHPSGAQTARAHFCRKPAWGSPPPKVLLDQNLAPDSGSPTVRYRRRSFDTGGGLRPSSPSERNHRTGHVNPKLSSSVTSPGRSGRAEPARAQTAGSPNKPSTLQTSTIRRGSRRAASGSKVRGNNTLDSTNQKKQERGVTLEADEAMRLSRSIKAFDENEDGQFDMDELAVVRKAIYGMKGAPLIVGRVNDVLRKHKALSLDATQATKQFTRELEMFQDEDQANDALWRISDMAEELNPDAFEASESNFEGVWRRAEQLEARGLLQEAGEMYTRAREMRGAIRLKEGRTRTKSNFDHLLELQDQEAAKLKESGEEVVPALKDDGQPTWKLARGWVEHKMPVKGGRSYYYGLKTGKSVWDRPAEDDTSEDPDAPRTYHIHPNALRSTLLETVKVPNLHTLSLSVALTRIQGLQDTHHPHVRGGAPGQGAAQDGAPVPDGGHAAGGSR
eukprot:TRINITY_DN12955_c0_g1_i5.p1 TRINITY_DN12955_c0_g1~~TRINITY_DN12955_c0_g1_i5.p1  ORF type:complete len:575 (-),score=80.54 TRINITY_DN12955_c0_g1_i5:866-2590(-)